VALASLRAHADGTVEDLNTRYPAVDMRLTVDGLSVAALATMLPALTKAGWPPIVASAAAHLSGRAGRPATMSGEVTSLKVSSRKTDLTGSLAVRDFARPQIDLRARSSYLDTADLLPRGAAQPKAEARRPAAERQPRQPPAVLAHASGHARVTVARGVALGTPFAGLQADVELRDGHVYARKLVVDAWQGHISGDGTEVAIADPHGPFRLVGQVSNVELEQLLGSFGSTGVARGRLSVQLSTHGRGSSAAEIERTLTGTLNVESQQTQLLEFNLSDKIAGELARALPFHLPTKKGAGGTDLGTVRASAQFADGAMTFTKPLTADTPMGPLSVSGRLFFDGRLDLNGGLKMNAEAASGMTGNQVKLSQALPLSLKVGGDVHHPHFSIGNASDAAKTIAGAFTRAGGMVTGAAGGIMKGNIPGLGGKVPGRQQAAVPANKPAQPQEKPTQKLKGLFGH
jgi:hypothetical protein